MFLFQCFNVSPDVRESITVLDSGFHTVDSGFQVLDSGLCQWNLDSGFHSLLRFRIELHSGFHEQNFPGSAYMGYPCDQRLFDLWR